MVRVELRFNGVDEPGKATRIGGGTPTDDLETLRRKIHDSELWKCSAAALKSGTSWLSATLQTLPPANSLMCKLLQQWFFGNAWPVCDEVCAGIGVLRGKIDWF